MRDYLVTQPSTLMTMTAAPQLAPLARPAAQLRSAGWFVRRAFFGMFALSVFALGGAWLLHASIEPDGNTLSEQTQSE